VASATTTPPLVSRPAVGSRGVKYITDVSQVPGIPDADRRRLEDVSKRYVFRVNDYYLRLIDWTDPNDPLKQLIIPREEELNDWGRLDASNEASVTVARGAQHKYRDTALLLVNEVCGAYCRYCFRKRLFMNDNDEASLDISAGLEYIRAHPEITNVLLTGGDPLILATRRLRQVLGALREIPHVQIVRLGSKIPAFNPFRILNDPELQDVLRTYSTPEKRIYLMAHFDHPRELTDVAVESLSTYLACGVVAVNQCPMIRGVNDDVETLVQMYRKLSFMGVPPYYLFQGRPTAGNEPYEVPIVRGFQLLDAARSRCSGLAARARFCMSHETGKIEVVGVDAHRIYMRYHRAKFVEDEGRFMVFRRDDEAFWLDQLTPVDGLGTRREGRRTRTAACAV
jgi:KamA family protein